MNLDDATLYQREDAVSVPAQPGTVVFHHGWALHMSPPNHTDSWRRAIVLHFVLSDAKTRIETPLETIRAGG